MPRFQLDPRLEADSVPVALLDLSAVRLMKDSRWPWLLLVPQRADVSEIFDLSPEDQALLHAETVKVARLLKDLSGADKINIGAIGNIVRQLHVHVIARFDGDENWPKPVWGFGTASAYPDGAMEKRISHIQEALAL